MIAYKQLGQLIPIEEIRTKTRRSINTVGSANYYQQSPASSSDKQTVTTSQSFISIVVTEIVSVFSQKESSIYSLPNIKTEANPLDKPDPYIELTFMHNKLGQQENLTNFRCVQLQDSETVPFAFNNNRVLSVEQAAFAVANEPSSQQNSDQINTNDYRFLAKTANCQTIFTNLTQTTCRCTSLGTFTVLADLGTNDELLNQSKIQNRLQFILQLNHLCELSCSLCIVILIITIVSFYFHKNNLKSTKTINHLLFLRNNQTYLPGNLTFSKYQNILLSNQAKLNYLICLFFLECSMFASLTLSETSHKNQVFCRIASLAVHYFILTTFSWLLFNCFVSSYLLAFTEKRQHQQTATTYNNQHFVILNPDLITTTTASSLDLQSATRHNVLHTFKLLTYLLPGLIVFVSFLIDPPAYCSKNWIVNQSSNETQSICWHVFDNMYIMFLLVPLIALLLASIVFVIYSLIIRMNTKHSTDQKSNKQFSYQTDINNQKVQRSSKHSLFASNTVVNLFNTLISTVCWMFGLFYLNNLLENFENFYFNNQIIEPLQQQEQSTYAEPMLLTSNLFTRPFNQFPDSNIALFSSLFTVLNVFNCLVLLIKLGIQDGLIRPLFSQVLRFFSLRTKQQSIHTPSQLYMAPNYYDDHNQRTNSTNSETLKYDPKRFYLNGGKFDQNSANSFAAQPQQQPLIPPPQIITMKNNLNNASNKPQFNPKNLKLDDDDVYENDVQQQDFSEQIDQQTSEQSDAENFNSKTPISFDDDEQFENKDLYFKKNKAYGQRNLNQTNRAQLEHFYECIEDANQAQFYEPMMYSAAYGTQQHLDYPQRLLNQAKYNRYTNNQLQSFNNLNTSDYENPIDNSRSIKTNKLLRNYSSNDFLNERDSQSRLDQPLLPTNAQNLNLSMVNHRNFKKFNMNRFNPTSLNNSFSSTIGRNELSASINGLRNSNNFRTNRQKKDLMTEKEQNLKQIQQQLKQYQMQLIMNNSKNLNQDEELKDQQNCLGNSQTAQQNSYLSSNSSVSDNVNSSV